MTRCVLSIGSNMGDRLARLQAVVDALGGAVVAVSPVYETAAWGVEDQASFLNAVVIADDDGLDPPGWLSLAQQLENDNDRVRTLKWGPRTLDVDLVSCTDGGDEVISHEPVLTLPHPFAHLRAFVLIPWLAVEPGARLSVGGRIRPVRDLLDEIDRTERDGVRLTDAGLARAPRTPDERGR